MSKVLLRNLGIIGLFFGVLGAGLWFSSFNSNTPGPEFVRALTLYEKALSESFDTASTGAEFDPALKAFKEVPWSDPKYSLAQTFIAEIEAGRALSAGEDVEVTAASVTIYTTKNCGYCKRAVRWMKANEINFVEVDVRPNSEARKTLFKKADKNGVRLRGVPVFEVESELIQGFSEAKLEDRLKAYGYLQAS